MNILITGAAGFLGSACVERLRRAGHHIIATDRRGEVSYRGDLSDPAFVDSLPEVDTVIHCAGVQYVSDDLPVWGRKGWFYRNNVLATKNLTARYAGAATHFIHISTSMIYDQTGLDVYEVSSPCRGSGVYSASKLATHEYVMGMPNPKAVVVPCIIAGEGRGGLFVPFVRLMTSRGVVVFPGSGQHKIHMVHVEDLTALIALLVEQRATGLFNAASPGPLSITEWIDEIEAELQLPRVKRIRLPLSPIHALSRCLGYTLLAREQLLMLRYRHVLSVKEAMALGWRPQWTNARIVRDTAAAIALQLNLAT